MSLPLDPILKKVSRSLYLSFRILPCEIRDTLALGYLLCRAADSLADTRILPRERRLKALELFRGPFQNPAFLPKTLEEIRSEFSPLQNHPWERLLLEHLSDCIGLWNSSLSPEKELLREVVLGVTEGMRMDLSYFPGEDSQEIRALPNATILEEYCDWIGGCPGVFWSRLCLQRIPGFQGWPPDKKHAWVEQGRLLGQGLQITNILRDVAQDLRLGRCYLPSQELVSAGLAPQDLLHPSALERFHPVLRRWTAWAMDRLDAGKEYLLQIPNGQWRLRAGALWPTLLALKTLRQAALSKELLNPQVRVKVKRADLYTTLLVSFPALFSSRRLDLTYQKFRRRLMNSLVTTALNPATQTPPSQ